ncbi:MAG TPA: SMP-30/gluconolactonase/LRE family protein [Bryobacteraceae bacterium]|nr:SMP-30/gluconolactonase/LRE family protein [Bryobacteraceae bacterium]
MKFRLFSSAIALASCLFGQQYVISTIAGNNTAGFSGDNGPATSAQLNQPGGIAIDSSGSIYIADGANHRVRKVSNGTITTVAGTGTAGYRGDGKAASSAQLNNPVGVALDGSGNLYIADAGNNVIRQVSTSGTITTFAGSASLGAGSTGDGGPATSAQLNDPVAVAVDSAGNLYIADANNNSIREVSNKNISTVVYGMHHPDAVSVDAKGNIFVADTVARRIVEYSAGNYNFIAGNLTPGFSGDGGPAANASLFDPMGVAVDASGNVFIADTFNSRIRLVTPNGIINTIAGTGFPGYYGDGGPALQADIYFPRAVAVDAAGNVYISDSFNHVIRELQPVAAPTGHAVVNAASYAPQISPGSLATLFGTHLASALTTASAPLPVTVAGVSISVNGRPAPILAVTPTQVNFQVPWETLPGSAEIAVGVNGIAANTLSVTVLAAAPGIFVDSSGRAVVQNSDYSQNSAANPAKPGSAIVAYLTGSGPTDVTLSDGAPASAAPLAHAMSQVSATVGSLPAQVMFTGLAPGFVGLTQMNIVLPDALPSGDYPLTVNIAGVTSNAGIITVAQ